MSPETHTRDSDKIDTHLLDIWSAGMVLVHLTTGTTPWQKASTEDLGFLHYAQQDTCARLADVMEPWLSDAFIRFTHGLLRVRPEHRIPLKWAQLELIWSKQSWLHYSKEDPVKCGVLNQDPCVSPLHTLHTISSPA